MDERDKLMGYEAGVEGLQLRGKETEEEREREREKGGREGREGEGEGRKRRMGSVVGEG